jgi:formate dehydrogenase major subunit
MSGKTIRFTLDGREVEAKEGETIWQVAKREGTSIPHLCWRDEPGYRADGNCRACMVEVEGERVLAASCIRQPAEGMVVNSQNERASTARKMVIELLMADQPDREDAHDQQSSFFKWADSMQVDVSRFPRDDAPKPDVSHPAMAVNLDACIHCNLCVRACREVQVNDVIGMAFRGPHEKIVFDFDDPMGASTCVACGECVQACPTGALMPKSIVDENQRGSRGAEREVDSVCPYCGVGCQITYNIRTDEKTGNEYIAYVEGKGGPANENRLCVKGRFGFDYVASPERLTKPLIRKPGLEKGINMDPLNPLTHFREASWEEALEFASKGLRDIRDAHGGNALAGFGSAKCSNEEAYSSRSWCAPASGPTMSTTAPGFAMRLPWPR